MLGLKYSKKKIDRKQILIDTIDPDKFYCPTMGKFLTEDEDCRALKRLMLSRRCKNCFRHDVIRGMIKFKNSTNSSGPR